MTLDEIIAAFKSASVPPKQALAAAVPRAPELALQVCELAEKVYCGAFLLPGDQRLLLYGLHVMAAARDQTLWPRVVELARLAEEELDDLFPLHGSLCLTRLMLSVWDGDADALFRLIEHADMVADGKWALLDCTARLTFDGRIPRERTAAFLERFEREGLADEDDETWWAWKDAVTRLGLTELEPALHRVLSKPTCEAVDERDRAACLEEMARAAAAPNDPASFDTADIRPVDDPVEGIAWLDRMLAVHAQWAAETAATASDDASVDTDPAKAIGLTDEELSWLARFLVSRQVPDTTMPIEMLDGLLTALVIGPALVPQSEYMAEVWGTPDGAGPIWDTHEQTQFFMALVARHWNAIAARRAVDGLHAPIILSGSDDERGVDWANGFLMAVDLRHDAWEPLFNDRRGGEIGFAITALADADDPEVIDEPLTPRAREDIIDSLPRLLQLISAFWRSPDHRMPRREPVRTAKVGRNEPCPCGSGKKYKKCCAGAAPPLLP